MKLLIGDGVDCKKGVISLSQNAPNNYVTLIRLDKPIYQPGDKVRFLVFALNFDTTPFNFEHINVKVLNSKRNVVKTFDFEPKDFKFDGSFKIPEDAKPEEKWSLKVQLNKNLLMTTKSFDIKEKPFNRIKVLVEAPSRVSIYQREVSVNVFAKHFSGVFAGGTAIVKASIVSFDDENDVLTDCKKEIKISARDNQVSFDFERDFGINIILFDHKIIYNVTFHDDLTQGTFESENIKTILSPAGKFTFKYNKEPFHRGHDHNLTVKVHSIDGHLIADKAMRVDMIAKYSNDATTYHRNDILENGAVKFILNATQATGFIDIELKTDDSKESFRMLPSVNDEFFEISVADDT